MKIKRKRNKLIRRREKSKENNLYKMEKKNEMFYS